MYSETSWKSLLSLLHNKLYYLSGFFFFFYSLLCGVLVRREVQFHFRGATKNLQQMMPILKLGSASGRFYQMQLWRLGQKSSRKYFWRSFLSRRSPFSFVPFSLVLLFNNFIFLKGGGMLTLEKIYQLVWRNFACLYLAFFELCAFSLIVIAYTSWPTMVVS